MAERKKKVLIIDDDKGIHIAAKYVLREKYDCFSAYHGDEARTILLNQPFDVALLDIHMRRYEEGLEFLPILKEIDPDLEIIIVSGNSELDLASRAIKLGASAYLMKEHSADQLMITIESALVKRELAHEHEHYVRDRKRVLERNKIIGASPAIKALMQDIEKVRRARANVIITAETGCGKELVARHIGSGDGKPFVAVDSSTITSSMAESLLFGHEKGAFTGATAQAKGFFEEADGGTIYFDEISNMPFEIQAKLLRVIQEKEVKRLGSSKMIPLEFRVICATNKDLETASTQGSFKHDLFQRLNVISLRIPPLRERPGDIPVLIGHFFKKFRTDRSPSSVSEEAMHSLMLYQWPGNVRELENLIANLCAMVDDQEQVEVGDLPAKIREQAFKAGDEPIRSGSAPILGGMRGAAELDPKMDFYRYMHQLEGEVLRKLYEQHQGNISQMSKRLQVSRSHLYSKLHAHRIHE